MSVLQIDALLGGSVYVPFVDRLGDGETPFVYPNLAIVGGVNGDSLAGLVPGKSSALEASSLNPVPSSVRF